MAKITVEKIKPRKPTVRREMSHTRQAAERIGLKIPKPEQTLPVDEQEWGDSA